MERRTNRITAFLAVLFLFPLARTTLAEDQSAVLRFIGTGTITTPQGPRPLVLSGETALGGSTVQFALQLQDSKKPASGPKTELETTIKSLARGDLIEVTVTVPANLPPEITKIETYTAKPGEDSKNGYIFHEAYDKKDGSQTTHLIKLSKYGQEVIAVVPARKEEKGQPVPDPDIEAAAGKLKDGDMAWVDLSSGSVPTIHALAAWKEPETGKLVKVETKEVDGLKKDIVSIDKGGQTVTIAIPGSLQGKRWVTDSRIAGEARRLRAGSMVQYLATEDNSGTLVLRDIEMAPKEPAKPVVKEPVKPAKKDSKK